ncbi:Uu.00g078940.m01.CDS01 [Anthostomella pinea]|uniref:Uu.00g078940.m01.CDS01 n=1 Tax=Anthostomella pinea TaxID=933095 RepID=A0AAI8YJA9_9PEZI|nr:Uu.00g078940.m01.CDS01 [Anthostomella pinea]
MVPHIPAEILTLIFEHLHHEDDRTTLANIVQAFKWFRTHGQPPLYRSFEVYPPWHDYHYDHRRAVTPFYRAIAESPHLRPYLEEWARLSETTRLLSLTRVRTAFRLPQSTTTHTSTISDHLWFMTHQLRALLAVAPNIQHLFLEKCLFSDGDFELPKLTKLVLVDCFLKLDDLTNLLKTSCLEKFVRSGYRLREVGQATAESMVGLLRRSKQTLQHLEIDLRKGNASTPRTVSCYLPTTRPATAPAEYIRSLKDFPQLRIVKLSQDAFYKPPGL